MGAKTSEQGATIKSAVLDLYGGDVLKQKLTTRDPCVEEGWVGDRVSSWWLVRKIVFQFSGWV